MSKKEKSAASAELLKKSIPVFSPVVRMVIPVPHRELDNTIVTSQGCEKSVRSLYEDYVMGVLDPRQLGAGSYDPDGSDDVDPFNTSGLTFEEATAIEDAGRNAAREVKQRGGTVADHPRESSQQQEKEKPHEGEAND